MGVENILIVVYVWHQRMLGLSNATEVYKSVLERAKELLTSLHKKVLAAEAMLNKRMLEQEEAEKKLAILPKEKLSQGQIGIYDIRNRIKGAQSRMLSGGQDLVTKVYPTDVIPDQPPKRQLHHRPNNFMSALSE